MISAAAEQFAVVRSMDCEPPPQTSGQSSPPMASGVDVKSISLEQQSHALEHSQNFSTSVSRSHCQNIAISQTASVNIPLTEQLSSNAPNEIAGAQFQAALPMNTKSIALMNQLEPHSLTMPPMDMQPQNLQSMSNGSHDALHQMLMNADESETGDMDDLENFHEYSQRQQQQYTSQPQFLHSSSNDLLCMGSQPEQTPQGVNAMFTTSTQSQSPVISGMPMSSHVGMGQSMMSHKASQQLQQHRVTQLSQQQQLQRTQQQHQMLQHLNPSPIPTSMMNQGVYSVTQNSMAGLTGTVMPQQSNSIRPQQLVGGWQSNIDIPHRKVILSKIVMYLQQRRPNTHPEEWTKKVPQMAKRLEDSLYRNADSFEMYNDLSTLRSRLQHLALKLGNRAQQAKLQQQQIATGGQPQVSMSTSTPHGGALNMGDVASDASLHLTVRPQQPVLVQPAVSQPHLINGQMNSQHMNAQSQLMLQQQGMQQKYSTHTPSIDEKPILNAVTAADHISPSVSRGTSCSQLKSIPMSGGHVPSSIPSISSSISQSAENLIKMEPLRGSVKVEHSGGSVKSEPMNSDLSSTFGHIFQPSQGKMISIMSNSGQQQQQMLSNMQRNPPPKHTQEQRRQALQQQQQRLLLLRHASKCPTETEGCGVTPHCANMKKLWKHIADCKVQTCNVPHCVSSRFVLSHYHRCKDNKCAVCAPVREVIAKSHARTMDHQQLQQQQQHAPQSIGGTNLAIFSPAGPLSHNALEGGRVPASTLIGLPKLSKEQVEALTPAQQSFLRQKSQSTSQAASAVLARLTPEEKTTLNSTQINARQRTEAVAAALKLDILHGLVAGTIPNAHSMSAEHQQLVAQQQELERAAHVRHQQHIDQQNAQPHNGIVNNVNGKQKRILSVGQTSAARGIDDMGCVGVGCDPSNSQPKRPKIEQTPHVQSQLAIPTPASISDGMRNILSSSGSFTDLQQVKKEASTEVEMTSAEDCTSLCEAFEEDQIIRHCESLRDTSTMGTWAGQKVRELVLPTLKVLQEHQFGWVFNTPVDPIALGLPDYFNIIKDPMDLGTIRFRLDNGSYVALDAVADDIRLTFRNAMKYNTPGSEVYPVAQELLRMFETMFVALKERIKDDPEAQRVASDRCALCGFSQLTWEPPVYYCNGSSCGMSRIRRNSYFFTAGANQFHWCTQCFSELRDNEPVRVGDHVLSKRDLVRKKNDEVQEEPWVECTDCARWAHQACSLFNARRNLHEDVPFSCPDCILAKRRRAGNMAPTARKLGGKDILHTPMSKFIEDKVKQRLEQCYAEAAAAGGLPPSAVPKANPIHIKVVSNTDVTHVVKSNFAKRFAPRGFPSEFLARSKCLLLFQELDGVDVLLFGMYVYEYGHNCGPPNQRRVYVSYLDSVHYFRPRQYRTTVYKEIIVAYLEFVKQRGFHTAHIWACPPLKGDDYILYCHPEDQKTPKDDRLQNWYISLLEDAKQRGIVESLSNLYDEFWCDPNADPTSLPYLEGDYWIGEAENIIKDLDDEASSIGDRIGGRKTGGMSKMRKKAGGGGSRKRDGKGIGAPDGRGHRDPVMQRLGEIIGPMKCSFIVAHLLSRSFAKAMEVRYAEEREVTRAKEQCQQLITVGRTPDPALKVLAQTPIAPDETAEMEEVVFSEIFDTRQTFLNLCQGNHYQFDQLRRAKHSSMMVLYFLSTPGAPKFLSNCTCCQREIVAGNRYVCASCEGFELCAECVPRIGHPHELRPVPVKGKAEGQGGGGAEAKPKTDVQRRERKRSIMLHMQLLTHASVCVDPKCPSTNCSRMKGLLGHVASCTSRAQGAQCNTCKRILVLLTVHARQCKKENCKMPQCMAMRQHMRAVLEQQQQMDDRRRQHMYEWYRERARAAAGGVDAPTATSK